MELPYLAYFNLREEPFSTVPSPRYFFLTTAHGTALEKTAYVVGAKKGLAAVFGDTGTGKSSLARLLYQKFLDSGFLVSLLTNPSYPTANSFLRTIAQEFGTPKTDKSFKGMLDIFKAYLFAQAVEQGKTVVLIIDEAQTLKPPLIELLRQLINFETNDMKLLQLVLFAQEELRDTLARPKLRNFRSRIAMASTLERLGLEELEAMLKFRWEVASGGAAHPFTREAIEAIFDYSQGMPREANILADNALLLAFYQKQRQIQREQVEQVAADRWENLNRREAAAWPK
ncbi:MAG: AAA family ATPase [Thermoproteota archaeon]|nr:AAA family ATPase [Thermoproteota archaeon]